MDYRRHEVIDIAICSRRLTVDDWKVSGNPLVRISNRYILPSSIWWKKNGIVTPNTQTRGEGDYRADLEAILKKAPSRFHTLDNLEMTT